MANTVLEFPIQPYFGGAATADGAVTPNTVVPTTLFLRRTDSGSQVAPAGAGYALSNTVGWLYQATASEALVGLYYWYVEDADDQVIADGYIVITADDLGPYRAGSVVDQINADPTQQQLQAGVASIKSVTDKVDTALETDGAFGWQLTTLALANTPDIWSAGQRDQVLGYDSKIDDIPSDVRTNFSTELARIDASISSRFAAGSYVAPNNSGISDILTAVQTDLPGQISGLPDVPAILVGLLDTVNSVDGFSLRQLLRGAGAAVLGELGGGGTSTETIHAMDGSKVRITATVDENGNRTNLVFDFD